MMFTKQHYVKLAGVLAYSDAPPVVISMMISMLENDNANFNKTTFQGYMAGLMSPGI